MRHSYYIDKDEFNRSGHRIIKGLHERFASRCREVFMGRNRNTFDMGRYVVKVPKNLCDGNTRRVEAPGSGYTCLIVEKDGYLGVDVLDPDGFVCHEATYYPTLEALEAVGVTINLI